jgi:outer membrane protein insertion porin family
MRFCYPVAMLRSGLAILWVMTVGSLPVLGQSVPILSVTFEGNKALEPGRLKSQLKVSRDGGWYHPETLKMELRAVEKLYHDEGFLRANLGAPVVEFQTVQGKGQVAVIRIPVSEGARYTLGELTFKNSSGIKPAALMQLSPVRAGQPYSRSKIAQFKEKIEEGYHSLGYLRFEVTVREEIQDSKKVVDCVFECKEGNIYRTGKISIAGDESINRSEFKKQILLSEGGVYNPELLTLSVAFLNSLRVYRPVSESDVEIRIDDAKSTVDLIFHLVPLRKNSSSS